MSSPVTIEIPQGKQREFMKYIHHHYAKLYETMNIRRFMARSCCDSDSVAVMPYGCEFSLDYKDNKITISIKEEGDPIKLSTNICYFVRMCVSHENNLQILSEFVKLVITSIIKDSDKNTVQVLNSRAQGGYWTAGKKIYAQSFKNIFVPEEIKSGITEQIDRFITARQQYIDFGRTHKLCFLLTGVPGSGKSSIIKAVAKHYGRDLYVMNLTKSLTDDTLVELANELKDNAILLLEDIDSFFVDRETQNINISFSAFINMLDGATTPSNLIIFMTANNPERLDQALIRPGRVDRIFKFDYPRKKEVKDAFDALTDETTRGNQFEQFYKCVGNLQISMAAIVDFLFRHPKDYMSHIEELTENNKLLHEIVNNKSTGMYN